MPAPHGLLIESPLTKRRVVQFVNAGAADTHRRWDYEAIQRAGAAWQAPALRADLNPAWDNFSPHKAATAETRVCSRQ